jgi:hypothetical protein
MNTNWKKIEKIARVIACLLILMLMVHTCVKTNRFIIEKIENNEIEELLPSVTPKKLENKELQD